METNLKKIGNSFGVIINKKLLEEAGISNTTNITIEARRNTIIISPITKRKPLNRDLSTWRKQIKDAIKQGQKPEKSIWGNKLTEQEEKEWKW
jgi:antitoxin component of MazEF toxin-antitoxin module